MIRLVLLISDSNYISTSFPASSLIRSPGCNPQVLSDRPSSSHSHTSNHLIRSFALIYFHFKRSFILTSSKVLVKLTISSSNLALISNIISLFTLSHDINIMLHVSSSVLPISSPHPLQWHDFLSTVIANCEEKVIKEGALALTGRNQLVARGGQRGPFDWRPTICTRDKIAPQTLAWVMGLGQDYHLRRARSRNNPIIWE